MRYFIVFYLYENNHETGIGYVSLELLNQYPNYNYIISSIKEDSEIKKTMITNIIELNKEDFDNFNK